VENRTLSGQHEEHPPVVPRNPSRAAHTAHPHPLPNQPLLHHNKNQKNHTVNPDIILRNLKFYKTLLIRLPPSAETFDARLNMVQRRSTPEEKTKNKNKNIYIRQNKTIRLVTLGEERTNLNH